MDRLMAAVPKTELEGFQPMESIKKKRKSH